MKLKQKMLVAWKREVQTARLVYSGRLMALMKLKWLSYCSLYPRRRKWRELNSKAEAFHQNRTIERGFLV